MVIFYFFNLFIYFFFFFAVLNDGRYEYDSLHLSGQVICHCCLMPLFHWCMKHGDNHPGERE